MSEKKSFILYNDYKKHIDLLTQSEKGDLLDCIFSYANGEEVEPSGVVSMAFSFIKSQMERDKEAYENKRKSNKYNGSKGGRPKESERLLLKPKETQNNPTVIIETQKSLNDTVTDTDTVTVTDNGNVNVNVNKPDFIFKGEVVKLTKKDFDRWLELFPNLNLEAELYNRDLWLAKQDLKTKCTWFQSTSAWFAKLDKEREPVNEKHKIKNLCKKESDRLKRPLHGFERSAIEEDRKVTSPLEIKLIKEWCREHGYDETIC